MLAGFSLKFLVAGGECFSVGGGDEGGAQKDAVGERRGNEDFRSRHPGVLCISDQMDGKFLFRFDGRADQMGTTQL